MSDVLHNVPEIYLPQSDLEKQATDVLTKQYDLLVGEWDQLLHNDTCTWKEAAEIMCLPIDDISTDGELDQTKLADVFLAQAEKITKLLEPDKRYMLNYEPFPHGKGFVSKREKSDGREDQPINRVLYLKEVLSEMGLEYSLSSPDSSVLNTQSHTENILNSKTIFQFYIYNLKKAVFVTNEARHATIVVHNVFEDEVKQVAENTSRAEVQARGNSKDISHIEWPGDPTAWKKLILNCLQDKESLDSESGIEVVDDFPPENEGWITIAALEKRLTVHNDFWLEKQIKILAKSKPAFQVKKFRNRNDRNRFATFCPQALVEAIIALDTAIELVPPGFLLKGNNGGKGRDRVTASTMVNRDPTWIDTRVKILATEDPQFKTQWFLGRESKQYSEYCGPALIAKLIFLREQEDRIVKQGWLLVGQNQKGIHTGVSGKVRKSRTWVGNRLKEFLASRPDLKAQADEVNKYNGNGIYYYPPEAVNYVEQESRRSDIDQTYGAMA